MPATVDMISEFIEEGETQMGELQTRPNGAPAPTLPTFTSIDHEIENILINGDLSKLSSAQRVEYYRGLCESLGISMLSRPFGYLLLNGKLTLYALKDCTDQLRNKHDISTKLAPGQVLDGVYVIAATAQKPNGRVETSTGAVAIDNLKGEARANAMMKAETKAKRRVTLSMCGLGITDESEVDSIPGARRVSDADLQAMDDAADIDTGGYAHGTKEAAQYVGEQKLLGAAEEPKEKGGFFKFLKEMEGLKAHTGEEEYYRILGKHGFEHANEIKDRGKQKVIYVELCEAKQQLQTEVF